MLGATIPGGRRAGLHEVSAASTPTALAAPARRSAARHRFLRGHRNAAAGNLGIRRDRRSRGRSAGLDRAGAHPTYRH
jgi:hypothetical protein